MGKGTEKLQKIRVESQAENKGVMIPAQVRWLSNTQTFREREQRGEIKASFVVFIVRGMMVIQGVVINSVTAVGV